MLIEEIMSFKKVLFALMTGITTGTIFGVTVTTKKGEAMRKKMLKDENHYFNVLKKKYSQSMSHIKTHLDKFFKKIGIPSQQERAETRKQKVSKNKLSSSNL